MIPKTLGYILFLIMLGCLVGVSFAEADHLRLYINHNLDHLLGNIR